MPAALKRLATSFAPMLTLGLSLRSCLAQPKYGITAIICRADALLLHQSSIAVPSDCLNSEMCFVQERHRVREWIPHRKQRTLHQRIVLPTDCLTGNLSLSRFFCKVSRACAGENQKEFFALISFLLMMYIN